MRPRKLTPTPSRNGRTSSSSLRASKQSTEGDERDREHVGGIADDARQSVGEPGADGAAVEPEVEDRGEDEPEREEREAEELVLVLRALSPRPLLHA